MKCTHGVWLTDTCNSCLADRDARAEANGEPIWIVNSLAELGVKVGGRFFFLYKGASLEYRADEDDDESEPLMYRTVGKREFGECCHPVNYKDPSRIVTVSLDDCDRWKPLPLAKKEER